MRAPDQIILNIFLFASRLFFLSYYKKLWVYAFYGSTWSAWILELEVLMYQCFSYEPMPL